MSKIVHPFATMSIILTTKYNPKDYLLKSLVKYLSRENVAGTFQNVCVTELQQDGVKDGEVNFFFVRH